MAQKLIALWAPGLRALGPPKEPHNDSPRDENQREHHVLGKPQRYSNDGGKEHGDAPKNWLQCLHWVNWTRFGHGLMAHRTFVAGRGGVQMQSNDLLTGAPSGREARALAVAGS